MPLPQSDDNRIAEAVARLEEAVARLEEAIARLVLSQTTPEVASEASFVSADLSALALTPEASPEAAPSSSNSSSNPAVAVAVQKKPPNGYQVWLTCLVGDMTGARAMVSQEIADWVVIEVDPKRTALFSGKPLSELDGRAWRALGVLAWKHISPEARAAFAAAHAAHPLAFD